MGDVVELNVITKLDLPPERVLSKALDHDLDSVLVVGFDKDGDLYTASSMADGGEVLWLMELCKQRLMRIASDLSGDDSA